MFHYGDVIMDAIASQITSLTIVYSIVYSDADHRKHQSSASLAFVWGIHRGPVNSPHKWSVTRKMFPFHDVIRYCSGYNENMSVTDQPATLLFIRQLDQAYKFIVKLLIFAHSIMASRNGQCINIILYCLSNFTEVCSCGYRWENLDWM